MKIMSDRGTVTTWIYGIWGNLEKPRCFVQNKDMLELELFHNVLESVFWLIYRGISQ
jgi:hypothetical protein